MRRRTRDWPRRVYRFWARPLDAVPDQLWATARAMRDLWNALWALHGFARPHIEATTTSDAKREAWGRFHDEAKRMADASPLNWECGPDVLDRFEACIRAKQSPRMHRRLDRIAVPHRYTGGGMPAAGLFSARAKRLQIERVPAGAYADETRAARHERAIEGAFGLDGDQRIRFRAVLHREIPGDAIVKRVTWLGNLHPTRGWQWALAITAEEPPRARARAGGRTCGVDIGWRRVNGGVRVAVVWSDKGEADELVVADEMSSVHSRRHGLPSSWDDLERYQCRRDELLETAKTNLRSLIDPLPPGYAQMRAGGLVRVLRDDATPAPARVLLAGWLREHDRYRSQEAALRDRLIARRNWLYRNFAARLTRRYDRICWEGTLGVKEMAEAAIPADEYALRSGMRLRHRAAVSTLRSYISQAAAREGCELVACETAHSTTTCAECGAQAEAGAALVLRCPNGHEWDQDWNAARNLFSQNRSAWNQNDGLRKSRRRARLQTNEATGRP